MQLLKSLTVCLSFSLLFCGCAGAPDVAVCVSDPESGGYQCSFKGKSSFLKYQDSANYTCLSPDDLDLLTSYIKRKLEKCK